MIDAPFKLISVRVLNDSSCGLHLIKVKRAEVLSAVSKYHSAKTVKSIFFQFTYVELRSDLHPDLRAVRVEFVNSTAVHEVLFELPFVFIAKFEVEDAPAVSFVFLKLSYVDICLCCRSWFLPLILLRL